MFGQARHIANVSYITKREDEIVILDDVRVRAKAGTRGHRLVLKIDGFNIANMQIGARQQAANGADGIEQADSARYDFRQHRLKDKVILFVDEGDLKIVAASEGFLQILGGVDGGKAAAQNDYVFTRCVAHRVILK